MASFRSAQLGPEARPVIVLDKDETSVPKASGRVQLPTHVRWSGEPKTYDLGLRKDRARVYEQVLREGTAEDIRLYVNIDDLIEMWDELVLPRPVRRAWARWIFEHRSIEVAC